MLTFSGPALSQSSKRAPGHRNEQASIFFERCLACRIEQEGDGNLSFVRSTKELIGNRDPADAVKGHGSAVSQAKSRDIAIMLGHDARIRPILQSDTAPLGLGRPIEQAGGTA